MKDSENKESKCDHPKAQGYCVARLAGEIRVLCSCPDCEAYFDVPVSELSNPVVSPEKNSSPQAPEVLHGDGLVEK